MVKKPWYKEGLRFACTECGQCCTGSPGYVWINEDEIADMADFLKISRAEFVQRYTRQIGDRMALLEYPRTYDCIFLRDNKCLLYKARPKQCSTFPFWPENLSSEKAWKDAGKRCEGIDHEHAPVISLKTIQKKLEELE